MIPIIKTRFNVKYLSICESSLPVRVIRIKNSSFMMHNEMESSNTYLDSISGNRRKTYYDHAQMR